MAVGIDTKRRALGRGLESLLPSVRDLTPAGNEIFGPGGGFWKFRFASIGPFWLSALVLIPVFSLAFGQSATNIAKPSASTAAEIRTIHDLYLFDQQLPGPGHTTLQEHLRAEAEVLAQAHKLLNLNVVLTGADYRDAAWLFQHGDDPKDYLLAHVLAIKAVALGEPTGSWIAASTLDRYLQSIGKEQIFGTQYAAGSTSGTNSGAKSPPSSMRTQAPFDPLLITPLLRQSFCVPSLAQQKLNLDELNRGKYPDATMAAPGCAR